jgi:apolipoprotein N-acyltransferase
MRAIELGLPLVRSANTGVSAVIDPVGRIIAHLGLGAEGVLDSALPKPLSNTVFSRVQDIPAAIVIALTFILSIRRRAKPKP